MHHDTGRMIDDGDDHIAAAADAKLVDAAGVLLPGARPLCSK